MSISLNDDEFLITFEELSQLDNADISVCVDKYCALSICEKSSAAPTEIYNIWVQKLLKAYDVKEFSKKDWQKIVKYLDIVLLEFVKNLDNSAGDIRDKQVEQWWLDTQELLKWLETVINNLEFCVLGLMLTFVLDVIIKTCKFSNKSNFKNLCNIQQLIIHLTNNFIFKIPLKESNEVESLNTVLSSLCDVGSLLSSADVKMSIETWRIVAKLGDKLQNFAIIKSQNSANSEEKSWQEKAILGIYKELHDILSFYKNNPVPRNNNLLQVAQFYLKILKLIIKYSKDKLTTFPAAKEFMGVYIISQHDLSAFENSQIYLCINKSLFEIFELIYKDGNIKEAVMQHLKHDMENFKSCDLILNYLKIYTENLCKSTKNATPDIEDVLNLYNLIFQESILFIDCDKYPKILELFVVLTILDSSQELHKIWCEYIFDSFWIRSYVSTEILEMYYSYTLNNLNSETSLKCLDYWLKIWNKLNQTDESYKQQKNLTEILLKTILRNINEAKLLQNNQYENIEIISLKCGRENAQHLQYFQTYLNNCLKKLQERQINGKVYRELLNLMDICTLKPQLVTYQLKETIYTTFCGIFSLKPNEFLKCQEFLHISLSYFNLQQDKLLNDKILNHLKQNVQYCSQIQNIFLIEFLLKLKPQSNNLLQNLQISSQHNKTLINLLDISTNFKQQSFDMNIFKKLQKPEEQSSNLTNDLIQFAKKPRLDEVNFYNIKYILNDLHLNSQKLLNFQRSEYDPKDYQLLETIKKNIEKCLCK